MDWEVAYADAVADDDDDGVASYRVYMKEMECIVVEAVVLAVTDC